MLTWQHFGEFRRAVFALMLYIENSLSDLAQSFSAVKANLNFISPETRSRYLNLSFIFSDFKIQFHGCGWWVFGEGGRQSSFSCNGEGSRRMQGPAARLGWFLRFQGTPVDGIFTLSAFSPSRACYFPLLMFWCCWASVMGNSRYNDDAVSAGPIPTLKWKPGGKHLSCERCALPAFSSFPLYDSDRDDSSTIKISTSFSVMIHSTFLFPLIKEGTSRWSRLNTIRWLRLDGEISIRAIRNELRAFGSSGSSLSGR